MSPLLQRLLHRLKKMITSGAEGAGEGCGQGRGRTADLPLFRRTLVPTELPGRTVRNIHRTPEGSDPDGTRTRDLRRDRATR